jgi:hypothetical protein
VARFDGRLGVGHAIASGDFGHNTAGGVGGGLRRSVLTTRDEIMAHYHPSPVIVSQPDHDKHFVVVRIQLDRDGRLSAPVQVVSTGSGPFYQSAAVALKRAIELSQPFDMFSPSTYDDWKDEEIMFDPGTAAPSR